MPQLFSPEYRYVWMAVLALALFLPVRRLIWVMTVRRAIRKAGEENVDEAEQSRLKRRAGVTSALLCAVFAIFYVSAVFDR